MLDELKQAARANPIWFGSVASITGVQAFFAWEFWGAVSQDPTHQLALRTLGLGFVAGEVVALDMASRADLASEATRASTLRALWVVLAMTTFTADINALSRVLREGDDVRAEAAATYDARQARLARIEARIEAADDPFDDELLSASAYAAAIAGKEREIAAARHDGAPGSQRRRLEHELTVLQSAQATALEVASLEAERAAMLEDPATHRDRPPVGPEEFAPLAAMATDAINGARGLFGVPERVEVSAEDVRAGMSWVATIAMKLMLTFGVWSGLQRSRRAPSAEETEDTAPLPDNTRADPLPGTPAESGRGAGPRPTSRRRPQNAAVFGRGGARFSR